MKRLMGKLASALCLALAMSPPFLLFGTRWLPDAPLLACAWLVGVTILAVLAGMPRGKLRLPAGIVGMAILAVYVWQWYPWRVMGLLLPLYVVIYWLILSAASRPPFDEWPMALLGSGIALHILCMMVGRGMGVEGVFPWQRTLLLVYVPILLLLGNRSALIVSAATRDGNLPPRRIRAGNRGLVLAVSAMLLVVTNLDAIRRGFYAVTGWIVSIVSSIAAWLAALLTTETVPEGGMSGTPDADMGFLPPEEASPFWQMLERIFGWLCMIALAVGIVYLLWRIARRLPVWMQRLMARMRIAARQLGEGVQEKSESILDWEEVRDAARARGRSLLRRFARPPRWESLDNRARVRWTYARWLRRQGRGQSAATARASLRGMSEGETVAGIYEAARYSDVEIVERAVEQVRDALREGQ